MSDFSPEVPPTLTDENFRVSSPASHGFSYEVRSHTNSDARIAAVLEHLEEKDPLVYELMMGLKEYWGIPDAYSNEFAEGYAVAYQLLEFQASCVDSELTPLTGGVVGGYITMLKQYDDTFEYSDKITGALIRGDKIFMESMIEYGDSFLSSDDIRTKHAFFVGFSSAYDVLFQQAKIDDSFSEYAKRSEELRVLNFTPDSFKRLIKSVDVKE